MAAKMVLSLVSDIPLPKDVPLPRHAQSCASSRTLTPVGAPFQDSDKESDEIDVRMQTPTMKVVWRTLKPWQAKFGDESSNDDWEDKSIVGALEESGDEWYNCETGYANPVPREQCTVDTLTEFGDECYNCETGNANQVFPLAPGLVNSVKMEQLVASSMKMPLTPGPIKTSIVQADPAPSIGSMGHPFTCSDACKYFRRKGGCRNGSNCKKCHLCHWSRVNTQNKLLVQDSMPLRASLPEVDQDDGPASVGSIGHPFTCNAACKYQSKKAGCKDGKFCARCHLCRWRRCCEMTSVIGGRKASSLASKYEGAIAACTQNMHEAKKLGLDRTSALKLSSPRRVEIQSNMEREGPRRVEIQSNLEREVPRRVGIQSNMEREVPKNIILGGISFLSISMDC